MVPWGIFSNGNRTELNLLPVVPEISPSLSLDSEVPTQIQQSSVEEQSAEASYNGDISDGGCIQQTMFNNMTIEFGSRTALPKLNAVYRKKLS